MDRDSVLKALQKIKDPLTGNDIVSAGLIEQLDISDNQVNIILALSSMNIQNKSELNFACISHIQDEYPMAVVNVHVKSKLSDAQQSNNPLPNIKNIIAVGSGKGGVGKSTVAVNLALGLKALGAKVGLLDADLYGPSMPTMLGLRGKRPEVQDVYGQPKIIPLQAYGMPVISIGFLVEPEQAVVLRGPRLAGIIKQFFMDCIWPELDYLIVDLPPGTGDVQLTLVQTVPVTGAVLVTTPQEVALADAIKAMNMFKMSNVNVPILGVVENMSWFTPAELPQNKYYIFGQGGGQKLAQEAETILLGQVPLVQSIRESGDNGNPSVMQNDVIAENYKEIASKTIAQVKYRNEHMAPTSRINISN
ncbi:MAG TPA: Mrp/NBP35 family ATP-binding protein [Saprospiraceae bacterium]|nr:Mrp/NBP35 family ATP-binding protein [Saprospiraceae bacterium]